jgi:hypothetical protein
MWWTLLTIVVLFGIFVIIPCIGGMICYDILMTGGKRTIAWPTSRNQGRKR